MVVITKEIIMMIIKILMILEKVRKIYALDTPTRLGNLVIDPNKDHENKYLTVQLLSRVLFFL